MQRRLQKFLPIVLIALAVQMLVQIGACWAAARAVSDPLASLPICHSSADAVPADSDQGDDSGHDGSCAICCVLNASASIHTPPQATLMTPLHREVEAVRRGYGCRGLFAAPIGSNFLARGPPQAT
jgi:Protein of unknown function (DUF2946)